MGALEFFEARHPHLTRQIMLAKKKGRLAHAYLLHSDNEETREKFATALAMTAACPTPDLEGRPCGKCPSCRQIAEGAYPEMFRLSPSSKSRIIPVGDEDTMNSVRWFENKFYFTSVTESGVKIGVIQDADRMQQQGQNMFLKTLEEPPRGSFFILCTGNPMELLPTIRSRCQKILMLDNRCDFAFAEAGALFDALHELQFKRGGIGVAEDCARKIIDVSNSLYEQAEADTEKKWKKQLEDAKKFEKEQGMEDFKKSLETKFQAAIESEYLRLRSFFLGAVHTWFAQTAMLAEGIPASELPNGEIFEGRQPPEDALDAGRAFKALDKADELLQTLDWNVNEELALREFCVSVAMA